MKDCPNCGGTLLGDGFKTVVHCENADLPPWVEVDSGPYYCEEGETLGGVQ